jgi:hypothetical protein
MMWEKMAERKSYYLFPNEFPTIKSISQQDYVLHYH